MKQLKLWLDEAKAEGTKKVFIAFHAPAFCRSGMGPIPEEQNPHIRRLQRTRRIWTSWCSMDTCTRLKPTKWMA